jgi:DNA-binding IclR family transcriptional regulator
MKLDRPPLQQRGAGEHQDMARRSGISRIVDNGGRRAGTPAQPGLVTALARGLEVLRAFSGEDQYLGNRELAARTGIPRPTISRLTQTLTALGYLRYVEALGKYQLGAGVLALGYRYLASTGLRDIARPHMQALADASDCAVALGAADRLAMTYIEVCNGKGPLILRLQIGARLPLALTSMGRAFVAGLAEPHRAALLDRVRAADPEAWPATKKMFNAALRQYRKAGFCVSEGDWHREISAVAVPLVLEGGAHVLAVNCGGSSLRLTRRVLVENLGPRLVDLVRQVEQELTGMPAAAE